MISHYYTMIVEFILAMVTGLLPPELALMVWGWGWFWGWGWGWC